MFRELKEFPSFCHTATNRDGNAMVGIMKDRGLVRRHDHICCMEPFKNTQAKKPRVPMRIKANWIRNHFFIVNPLSQPEDI
jgi:hypothetical protein